MVRLQGDGDEEQLGQDVQLQQERSEDRGVQLPEGRREDQEDQDDEEGSEQDLSEQDPPQDQDGDQDERSEQDLSEQDPLPDQGDDGQSGQGTLRAEQGGEEQQEQSAQLQVKLGGQLQGRQDDQQRQVNGGERVLQECHLLPQSAFSASSSGALFPVEEKELEELYEKIKKVWTLTAATRAFSAATGVQEGAVIFQTDSLYLLARNGNTTKINCSYDNHGSEHFLSGDLPEEFDYNCGQKTTSFRGRQSTDHTRILTISPRSNLSHSKELFQSTR